MEPKIPFPTKPPPSQPSNTHPSPAAAAAASSANKLLQDDDHDYPSTNPLEQQQKSSEYKQKSIKDSDFASGNHDRSSNLAQLTTAPSETTTVETPRPPPDLPGVPDHSVASEDDGNCEVNEGGQKQTSEERSSTDKLQMQDNDHEHLSVDPHEPHEQQGKPCDNRDQDSNVANGNREQSSNLTQGTTTQPETTTSTSETPKTPELTSIPEHAMASGDDGNSEANTGGQKQTDEERSSADKSQIQDNDQNPSVDAHESYDQQKKPSEDSGEDSEVANGNSEQLSTLAQGATTLPENTTTETLKPFPDLPEQEHTPPSQKQPNDVPSKQDPTANPNQNFPPDNQSDWQMGDSSTGADMVNPNQVSFDVLHVRLLHCIN